MHRLVSLISRLALVVFSITLASAQQKNLVRELYEKHEYMIPMRDGVRLFTAVYSPRDNSTTYPIILIRTPYSINPYGDNRYPRFLRPSRAIMNEGYIIVYQDVRGSFMSEGDWVELRAHNPSKRGDQTDESSDTYDTIEWLVNHIPRNNGRVGITGISYPGFYASHGTIDAHPALKASSPQAPIADDFIGDDDHHHGAFFLTAAFDFYASFGKPHPRPTTEWSKRFDHGTNDGYRFFLEMGPLPNANKKYLKGKSPYWNDMMEHGTYDEYWKKLNVPQYFTDIRLPVMTVGGWFDAENLYGALETYNAIERQNPGANNILVMGPWSHGQWAGSDGSKLGDIAFDSKTSLYFQENIELPFFNYYLKGKGSFDPPEATVFLTGRNKWYSFDTWPPAQAQLRALYFHAGKSLSFSPPREGDDSYSEYASDPSQPVPFTEKPTLGFPRSYMVEDQRWVADRPDVLTFSTEPLEKDVVVAGPITAKLMVTTTGTDADWVVKLIDEYPDDMTAAEREPERSMSGYEMLVRGWVMRGKFRNSYSDPEPFTPGQVTPVEFQIPDVFHSFRAGHRIMIQIQSSWFPLVDLNPGRFVDIYHASASDFQKTTQRVYHSSSAPSQVLLQILSEQ